MQQPSMQQRPTGITILAVLAAIGGILGLCASLTLVGLGGVFGGLAAQAGAPVGAAAALGGLTVVFGVLSLGLSVLSLVFAYGAWTLKPWAWTLGMLAWGVSLVLGVLGLLSGGSSTSEIVRIAIAGIILYYLNTPEVKQAFGRS